MHYECEILLRLTAEGKVSAVSLGLDLTLRDVQKVSFATISYISCAVISSSEDIRCDSSCILHLSACPSPVEHHTSNADPREVPHERRRSG